MPKLSIIVPIYNCEDYLEKTIRLLINQNVKDCQIILIDDGSADQSGVIAKALAGEDNRIHYIVQENGGPGKARNTGIAHALGEYVAFCDADDAIDGAIYEKLIGDMEQHNADLAMCDFYSERDRRNMGFPWKGDQLFTDNEIKDQLMNNMIGVVPGSEIKQAIWGSSCRMVIRKEILDAKEIRFPEDIDFAEDLVFVLKYLSYCKKVYIRNEVLYYYTMNPDSIMNSYVHYRSKMWEKRIALYTYIQSIIDKNNMGLYTKKVAKYSFMCYVTESTGNACKKSDHRNIPIQYREVKSILNHGEVETAFSEARYGWNRKAILHYLIKKKWAWMIFIYFKIRAIGWKVGGRR